MTAETVARMLGVPTTWVYRAAREGTMPCIRLGRYVRFERQSIELWLKQRQTGGEAQAPDDSSQALARLNLRVAGRPRK